MWSSVLSERSFRQQTRPGARRELQPEARRPQTGRPARSQRRPSWMSVASFEGPEPLEAQAAGRLTRTGPAAKPLKRLGRLRILLLDDPAEMEEATARMAAETTTMGTARLRLANSNRNASRSAAIAEASPVNTTGLCKRSPDPHLTSKTEQICKSSTVKTKARCGERKSHIFSRINALTSSHF